MKTAFYITIPIILLTALILWAIPDYETRQQRREVKYLTNEQIVEQTNLCEENGLRAVATPYNSIKVKRITCKPYYSQPSQQEAQTIKKSNITEVNVVLPETTPNNI